MQSNLNEIGWKSAFLFCFVCVGPAENRCICLLVVRKCVSIERKSWLNEKVPNKLIVHVKELIHHFAGWNELSNLSLRLWFSKIISVQYNSIQNDPTIFASHMWNAHANFIGKIELKMKNAIGNNLTIYFNYIFFGAECRRLCMHFVVRAHKSFKQVN